MSKHTPGPWIVDGHNVRKEGRTKQIAILLEDGPGTYKEGENKKFFEETIANASLIAAAPELLDRLKNCLFELDAVWVGLQNPTGSKKWKKSQVRKRIVDAIAKAEGKV